jgi:repressor LexA
MGLSERQAKMLDFIKTFSLESGYPPTIREIGEAVDITSTSVVNYNLNVLQREGFIFRDRTVSRGIKLVEGNKGRRIPASNFISVPLVGHIAAGEPIDVPEGAYVTDEENVVHISRELVKDENVYALKVKGTSMIDALINDGDTVIMKPATEAHNGEMVAVWLIDRDETTLKRFYNEGNRIRLQPENSTMAPIYVDPSVVQIQGKVIAVVRNLN